LLGPFDLPIDFLQFEDILGYPISFLVTFLIDIRKSDVSKGILTMFDYYKENTILQRLLWDVPEKAIPYLFIAKVFSKGRQQDIFLLVHL